MTQRTHKPTSKAGEEFIAPHKPSHKQRVLESIKLAKVGATQEEAAILADMRPDQVWKRLSELERDGSIFNTGITRKLKSGVPGIVWQATGMIFKEGEVPVIPKKEKSTKKIAVVGHIDNPLLAGLR